MKTRPNEDKKLISKSQTPDAETTDAELDRLLKEQNEWFEANWDLIDKSARANGLKLFGREVL